MGYFWGEAEMGRGAQVQVLSAGCGCCRTAWHLPTAHDTETKPCSQQHFQECELNLGLQGKPLIRVSRNALATADSLLFPPNHHQVIKSLYFCPSFWQQRVL